MEKSFLIEEKRRKKRKTFIKLLVLIVVLVGALIFIKGYIESAKESVAKGSIIEKSIEIPNGSSTNDIARILKQNKLIKNENIFKLYSKLEKKDGKYKAGIYTLNNGMSQEQIMNKLIEGGALSNAVKFTIPEGFELEQIADRLNNAGIIDKGKFMDLASHASGFENEYDFLKGLPEGSSLEGYLYPNTYEVYKDATEEEIIKKMLDNFNMIYTKEIQEKGEKLGLNTNQIITLASIIEREAMVEDERAIMSGVFHNRLKIDMPLQSCATVQYVLGERKPVLSNADVEIDSSYNTYKNKGLPPAPIASPGIKSIEAAVNPKDVDYLFFVRTGKDGSHTFSKTYEEHLKARSEN